MSGAVILPRGFYARPAQEVARDLLGKILIHGPAAGRIVEVEAYLGESDPAAHAFRGLTPRTRVLFGDPGHAYVYLIYGMYECLNLVAEPAGSPGCVLIRALEPLAGIGAMRKRCPSGGAVHRLASGPGKLTRAMGINRGHNGLDVTAGLLRVESDGWIPPATAVSPRIGISAAADWPLRFYIDGHPAVSLPRSRKAG